MFGMARPEAYTRLTIVATFGLNWTPIEDESRRGIIKTRLNLTMQVQPLQLSRKEANIGAWFSALIAFYY